jgi:hypothetical protein
VPAGVVEQHAIAVLGEDGGLVQDGTPIRRRTAAIWY